MESSSSAHPSKWTYKQLCRKVSTWSQNSIDFARIIPFEVEPVFMDGKMLHRPPAWLEFSRFGERNWILECKKQGVSEGTALRVWKEYAVAVASGRKQYKSSGEVVGVVI